MSRIRSLLLLSQLVACAGTLTNVQLSSGPAALVMSGPTVLGRGTCSATAFKIESRSTGGTLVAVKTDTTVILNAPAGGNFYSDSACTDPLPSSIVLNTGQSSYSFYFKATSGSETVLSASSSGLAEGTLTVTISDYLPTANTIASDRPLVSVTHELSSNLALTGSPLTAPTSVMPVSGSPLGSSAGPFTLDTSHILTVGGTAPVAAGTGLASTNAAPTSLVAHTPFTANISVTSSFPTSVPSAQQSCETLAPFASIACSLSGFTLSSSQILSGLLQTKAISGNGGPADSLLSNALTTKQVFIQRVTNLNASGTDDPTQFIVFNNRLWFVAQNSAGFVKLFSTDGTDLKQMFDIRSGADDNFFFAGSFSLTVYNNRLYFIARGSGGYDHLYSTDGTDLVQVTNTCGGSCSDNVSRITLALGKLFFVAYSAGPTVRIYYTDGTQLHPVAAPTGLMGGILGEANGRLFFTASLAANSNYKLFATDLSTLVQVSNIVSGGADFANTSTEKAVFNNRLYFVAKGTLYKLYSTDGTDLRQETNLSGASSDSTGGIKVIGSRFYFQANLGSVTNLYSSDGATLTLLHQFWSSGVSTVVLFTPWGGKIYFFGQNASSEWLLYSTADGINVEQAFDLPNPSSSSIPVAYAYGSTLVIVKGGSFWTFDGAQLKLVSSSLYTLYMSSYGGRLYTNAYVGSNESLFSSDGTDLLAVSNIEGSGADFDKSGCSNSYLFTFNPTLFNNQLYFPAFTGGCNVKLFRLCDTSQATCTTPQ